MPFYDYRCFKCGKILELLVPLTVTTLPLCPDCGAMMEKQLSTPGGFVFKGKGAYATDYKGK
jgi:putative FmdB family regulatory protein